MDSVCRTHRWRRFSLRALFVAVTAAMTMAALVGRELQLVRDRSVFLARMQSDALVLPLLYFPDDPFPTGPTIPFWRVWLGDRAEEQVVLKAGSTEADLQTATKLFPEALVVYIEKPEHWNFVAPKPLRRYQSH